MKITKLTPYQFAANTYIITYNKNAIVVDPSVELNRIKTALDGLTLQGILLTHGHFDHILTLEELLSTYNVPIYLHLNAKEKLANPRYNYSLMMGRQLKISLENYRIFTVVNEDVLTILPGKEIIVYETPGHSNCSVCYLIDEHLFTGDTLFKGAVGRTDLYSGNPTELLSSLQFLKTFPDHYKLYPGHNELTTIGLEKANNPYL